MKVFPRAVGCVQGHDGYRLPAASHSQQRIPSTGCSFADISQCAYRVFPRFYGGISRYGVSFGYVFNLTFGLRQAPLSGGVGGNAFVAGIRSFNAGSDFRNFFPFVVRNDFVS